MEHLFSRCGKVLAVHLRSNRGERIYETQKKKEFPSLTAYVFFGKEEAAERSLKLTGELVGQNKIYVDIKPIKSEPGRMKRAQTVFVGNLTYSKQTLPS